MNLISKFYNFYDQRNFREKIFLVLLAFAFWYFLYSILIFSWLDSYIAGREKQIDSLHKKIDISDKQIGLLNQAMHSSLYQEWMREENTLENVHKKYYQYVTAYSPNDSQAIIKILLNNRNAVNILEIKSDPPHLYKVDEKIFSNKKLYQKPYVISLNSNYREFFQYMKKLEWVLKNVAWDRLSYEVTQYPNAKIEVEFSILYENNKTV